MSENNNKKIFTAADIEKYHKGLLSAKEKHLLEKAALDDPFLSDALEGFTTAGVYIADDMKDLNERLAERIADEKRKLVTMPSERRQKFALWKVAAIIVLVAGAGFLAYQFGFNKKEKSVAETNIKKDESAPGTSAPVNGTLKQETSQDFVNTEKSGNKSETKEVKPVTTTTAKTNLGIRQVKPDTAFLSLSNGNTSPIQSPVANDFKQQNARKSIQENFTLTQNAKPKTEDINAANPVAMNKAPELNRNDTKEKESAVDGYMSNKSIIYKKAQDNIAPNIFRGRVLDANNNPVPFANITNIADSVGTYADSKGNFNFISADTVMNVEVRSVGFNNINTQLRNRVADNQVMLQEDRSLSARILLDTAKSNAIKRLHAAAKDDEDESEPEDGWGLYDTYVINNLRVPETFKTKPTSGQVEVSFEVDKNGDPTNFKITKSLCDACDKEAIRLIKEGPKWKRKAKRGKTTVTVSF